MKIGAAPVLCIGLAIGLIGAGFGYFHNYQPKTETLKNTKTAAESWETEAKKLPAAYKKRATAMEMVQQKADEWQQVVAVKTPSSSLGAGGINFNVSSYQLAVDSRVYRNSLQTAVNNQVKRGGVVVINGPEVEAPDMEADNLVASYYNYPAIPFPVVIFDLGTITVRGTYAQIKRNVEAWKDMPNYLAVADGLQLEGTSPNLTGTYSVTIVGYLRAEKMFPGVLNGAGAAPGGAPVPGGGPTRPGPQQPPQGAPGPTPPNRGGAGS
jgi:hypothetical protein